MMPPPSADPEAALPERDVLGDDPMNAEARVRSLRHPLTPVPHFFVRSSFERPRLEAATWQLEVSGVVERPISLPLAALQELGAETRVVTLECAGNGRTLLDPRVPGISWTFGATGTAEFTGVPLHRVLDAAGLGDDAVEVLFTGADRGTPPGWGHVPFQRSLPVADALRDHPAPLLSWQMNGAPLAPQHGAPVRLVVPGWYAVASVKWLVSIEALARPFEGHFQTDRYVYREPDGRVHPVRHMRVRALLLEPDPEAAGRISPAAPPLALAPGTHRLAGIAWSGEGAVTGVRISVDGGRAWRDAALTPPLVDGAPIRWHLDWTAEPGEHELLVRARDAAGNEQPLTPPWNALGYGNNVVQRVRVRVSDVTT